MADDVCKKSTIKKFKLMSNITEKRKNLSQSFLQICEYKLSSVGQMQKTVTYCDDKQKKIKFNLFQLYQKWSNAL